MKDVNEHDLEECLHRELRGLPGLKAPRTLAPRVMTAIAARQMAPWWRKAWADWPPGIRLGFLAVNLGLVGGLILAGLQMPQSVGVTGLFGGVGHTAAGWFTGLEPVISFVSRTFETFVLVLKAAPPEALWGLLAVVGLAYATCVGLGTLGYRLAFNRL